MILKWEQWIEGRALALWRLDGSPEGYGHRYWHQAKWEAMGCEAPAIAGSTGLSIDPGTIRHNR